MKKYYFIDYGSKTGPIRAYTPTPAGRMPTGGRRGWVDLARGRNGMDRIFSFFGPATPEPTPPEI